MITRPLDLQSRLSPPPRDADVLFWLNVGAVALFFALLGSRFILGTGVQVQLDIPSLATAAPGATSAVVSYRRDNMVLFEGGIYELNELLPPIVQYAKRHPGSTMLVRVDKQVSVQGLLQLFDLARQAGFAQVLLAAEPRADETPGLVTPGR